MSKWNGFEPVPPDGPLGKIYATNFMAFNPSAGYLITDLLILGQEPSIKVTLKDPIPITKGDKITIGRAGVEVYDKAGTLIAKANQEGETTFYLKGKDPA